MFLVLTFINIDSYLLVLLNLLYCYYTVATSRFVIT
jgi:hypothetical protein